MATRFETESIYDAANLNGSVGQRLSHLELAYREAVEPMGQKIARLSAGLDLERMLNPALHAFRNTLQDYTNVQTASVAARLAPAIESYRATQLQAMAPAMHALSDYAASANAIMATQLRDSWKPVLMRWAAPSEALLATQLSAMSGLLLETARPLVCSAATQILSNMHEPLLKPMRVEIANLHQAPTFIQPLADEEFLPDDIPLWPYRPPDNTLSLQPDTVAEPGSESTQPLEPPLTIEDLEDAMKRVLKQQKRPLVVRLMVRVGEPLLLACVTRIAFDHLQVDDSVASVLVKSMHIVVDGVTYVLHFFQ